MIFAENMYLISMLTGIVDGGGPVTFGVAQFSLTECVVYICICCMRCVSCKCLCICKYVDDEQVQVVFVLVFVIVFVLEFANMLMTSKYKLHAPMTDR